MRNKWHFNIRLLVAFISVKKMWIALVQVSPSVMITRFQDPLQVLLLIGHS